uniref:Uncharacterized protein n=1 Tax=Glossina austeni TaxID=7395 RepID=A0A1A9VNJ4_GLOAU
MGSIHKLANKASKTNGKMYAYVFRQIFCLVILMTKEHYREVWLYQILRLEETFNKFMVIKSKPLHSYQKSPSLCKSRTFDRELHAIHVHSKHCRLLLERMALKRYITEYITAQIKFTNDEIRRSGLCIAGRPRKILGHRVVLRTKLNKLELLSCYISGKPAVTAFVDIISCFPAFEKLPLDNLNIGIKSVQELCRIFPRLRNLNTLNY